MTSDEVKKILRKWVIDEICRKGVANLGNVMYGEDPICYDKENGFGNMTDDPGLESSYISDTDEYFWDELSYYIYKVQEEMNKEGIVEDVWGTEGRDWPPDVRPNMESGKWKMKPMVCEFEG